MNGNIVQGARQNMFKSGDIRRVDGINENGAARQHVLSGYDFRGERSTGKKADRAQPFAAQAEGGTVKLLRGPWNLAFLDEMEMFPFAGHDDQVDAGLEKAGDMAESKFGHGEQIDQVVEKAQDATGSDDQQ